MKKVQLLLGFILWLKKKYTQTQRKQKYSNSDEIFVSPEASLQDLRDSAF